MKLLSILLIAAAVSFGADPKPEPPKSKALTEVQRLKIRVVQLEFAQAQRVWQEAQTRLSGEYSAVKAEACKAAGFVDAQCVIDGDAVKQVEAPPKEAAAKK